MAHLKPWLKEELESTLKAGVSHEALPSHQSRGQGKRRHAQCVEVDEERSALKINDSETMVWCFVSKPGMKNFNNGNAPALASLNNKTITVEDWEFSAFSVLCPSFGEKRVKTKCQICILISKFVELSGERTTTIGKPLDLGEGSWDVRSILRTLSTLKTLVQALAQGQGLADLRDIDGVLMSAPDPLIVGLSWEDVDPVLLMTPVASRAQEESAESTALEEHCQHGKIDFATAAAAAAGEGEGRSPAVGASSCREIIFKHGGESLLDGMSQYSLKMDYEGELDNAENDFQSQAPSVGESLFLGQEAKQMDLASPTPPISSETLSEGNVFLSQEVMQMHLASPSSSPVSSEEPSCGKQQPMSQEIASELPSSSALSPPRERGDDYDEAPLGQGSEVPGERGAYFQGDKAATGDSGARLSWDAGESNGADVILKGQKEDEKSKSGDEKTRNDMRDEGKKDDEESDIDGSPVPVGLTQLEIISVNGTEEHQPRAESEARGDDEEEERKGRWLSPLEGFAVRTAAAGPSAVSENIREEGGEIRSFGASGVDDFFRQQVAPEGSKSGSTSEVPKYKGKGKGRVQTAGTPASGRSGSGTVPPAASSPEILSAEDILSPKELSAVTSSSSVVPSPNNNQLELGCLTQKRQGKKSCHPNSGACASSCKNDIRSRFSGVQKEAAKSHSKHSNSESRHRTPVTAAATLSAEGSGEGQLAPTPDTVEMELGGGVKVIQVTPWNSPGCEKAAEMLPARPLQGGSLRRLKRNRPLSDVLVVVDPKWTGQGHPPVIARGHGADSVLAGWLDTSRPVRPPRLTIGAWLDSCVEDAKRKRPSVGDGSSRGGGSGGWQL